MWSTVGSSCTDCVTIGWQCCRYQRWCCARFESMPHACAALAEEVRAGQKRLAEAQTALAAAKAASLAAEADTLANGARHLVARVEGIDSKGLQVGVPVYARLPG